MPFKKGSKRKPIFMGDFETTVYKDQKRTDVWASALTMVGDPTDHVDVFNSLPATYDWILEHVQSDCIIYYHNLKFDGSFWICYLLERGDYKECFIETEPVTFFEGMPMERTLKQGEFEHDKDMEPGTFKYLVSDMGAWYNIKIKRHDGHIIELRDSLKLIPVSVAQMGKSFKTKHQKSSIEYTGYRVPGGVITDEEKEYIANDVLVVKEVLEIMFAEGHNKLTIGACCLSEYKEIIGTSPKGFSPYEEMFPQLDKYTIDKSIYNDDNADEYIRRSYHGGWCYVKEDRAGKLQGAGCTADVNSLYPSQMHSESGNRYPIGLPHFFRGIGDYNRIKDDPTKYYFIRVRTRFYLKEGYLPFIQIKRNKLYITTEMLKTSDVLDRRTGKYHKFMRNKDGDIVPTTVDITLSKTDWELMQEHYELKETEILDGCWFHTSAGIFDKYINKYRKIKETATGAKRQIAKLFLNNLYGKMASSTNSSFKRLFLNENNALNSEIIFECNKTAGYIAVGAAITSYARAFTVRAAQANYDTFCYADTDSIHCCCKPEEVKGIRIHDTAFNCWKIEAEWDKALFVRQKTYAEHMVIADGEPLEKPKWEIKCAGLPKKCKELFNISLEGLDKYSDEAIMKMKEKYSKEEMDFISKKRTIEDFKKDLRIPGKLLPVHIPGGVVLADVYFTLH